MSNAEKIEHMLAETTDRVRRIETRLTAYLVARGEAPPNTRPAFSHSTAAGESIITIMSEHIPLAHLLAYMRDSHIKTATIYFGQRYLGVMDIGGGE